MSLQESSAIQQVGFISNIYSYVSDSFGKLLQRINGLWYGLASSNFQSVKPLDLRTVVQLQKSHIQRFAEAVIKREPTIERKQLEGDLYTVRGPELIQAKLKKQFDLTQSQAESEKVESFYYQAASEGFLKRPTVETFAGKVGDYEVGICHFLGLRPTMEDEHLVSSFDLQIDGKSYPVQLFGMFDGHGGGEAALYAKEHLAEKLRQILHESFQEVLEMRNGEPLSSDEMDEVIWNVLKWTFVELSCDFKGGSGTTATVMMVLNDKVWFANAGDSCIVASGRGQMTEDAKPDDPRYKKGIQKRYDERYWGGEVIRFKGFVSDNRINAILGTGRALGDHNAGPGVISRPKITCLPLSELAGKRVLLGCSEIFDVMPTKQVKSILENYTDQPVESVAQNIVYSSAQASNACKSWNNVCKHRLAVKLQAENPVVLVFPDPLIDNISGIVVQIPATPMRS